MVHGFSFLFACNHKISYRLLILVIVILDVFVTTCSLDFSSYPEEYSYFIRNRLLVIMTQIQMYGGLHNVIVSIIWFQYNKQIISNVESELRQLAVNLDSDVPVKKCSREMLTVLSIEIISAFFYTLYNGMTWTTLASNLAYLANISFAYCCSGILSCSLFQLGSFYDDFIRFNKYEDSVLRCQRISNIFENICHLFKVPMFLIISWGFVLTLGDLYALFVLLPVNNLTNNLLFVYTILNFQYPILMVIRSCNELNKKAKTFSQQLYWEMVKDKSNKLMNNEKLNFHFVVNEEMVFTACGFFNIDNSLIFSMISTATTYLVIVLQYGRTDKPMIPIQTSTSLAIVLHPQQ